MKNTIIWCLSFLLIIAFVPFASGINNEVNLTTTSNNTINKRTNNISSKDEAEPMSLTDEDLDIIACKVMEHIDKDANTETKKAILAVCINNYRYLKESGETKFATETSSYSDDFLKELKALATEENYILTIDGKTKPIPLTEQNGGYTVTRDEYPYIPRVASPWDTFSESFVRGAEYAGGVSIYGIGYLCENGADWKEALLWYIPALNIK